MCLRCWLCIQQGLLKPSIRLGGYGGFKWFDREFNVVKIDNSEPKLFILVDIMNYKLCCAFSKLFIIDENSNQSSPGISSEERNTFCV